MVKLSQLKTILSIFSQWTKPTAALMELSKFIYPIIIPPPTIPPTIECVVDTGNPFLVAKNSHKLALNKADIITATNCIAGILSAGKLIIPLRIVLVTSAPAKIAPLNSKIAAIISACLIVKVFAPTLVPKAFATSFHLY